MTKQEILDFLADNLYVDTSEVDEHTPLFSSGLIDSFSFASLLAELESRGGFKMDPLDITLENLDTIDRMLAFVASRSSQQA